MITVNVLRLLTFGGLSLEASEGAPPPRIRPQRLAILAVLASAGDRGVSRERLAGLFWSDTDDEHARHSLRQALYALRQELGHEVVQSAAVLTLDRTAITSDIGEFRAALAVGDRARAASLVTGEFLRGFYLSGAPEFERWVEEERAALLAEATRVTLSLARDADSAGDLESAAEWWRRLTLLDPLSGRFALGFLKALAASGDRAGALAFARAHESVVQRELEADADPEIRRLEAELRALPSPHIPRAAPTPLRAPDAHSSLAAEDAEPLHAPSSFLDANATAGTARRPLRARTVILVGTVVLATSLAIARWSTPDTATGNTRPVLAVGMIREDGIPDTMRIGGVLTDMLATNLARVAGLTVLANSRLFEVMLPGQDTLPIGYTDAARRAGATEILQGQLLPGPGLDLSMDLQRVDLVTGVVRGGYRVSARDRYALVDSMTTVIVRDLRLASSGGSVAEATTDSPIAYRLYEEGLRAYYQYDVAAARRLMLAALEEDSTFAMAAYYAAVTAPTGDSVVTAARARALRLAVNAPERERLTITADMLVSDQDPDGIAVVESLTVKYPTEPRAFELLSRSLFHRGEWREAVAAIETAIALDSASEPLGRQNCRLCSDLGHLAEVYLWWDSLPAAERTAHRFQRLRPANYWPWYLLVRTAAARGDVPVMLDNLRRMHETFPQVVPAAFRARVLTLAEAYDSAETELRSLLAYPRASERSEARWFLAIALRNQGRLAEAERTAADPDGRSYVAEGIVALERENARQALALFRVPAEYDHAEWPRGIQARNITWNKTLFGMALAATGDTVALRHLADTVEQWGQRSTYGRDRRVHHYLRGLRLVAEGRDGAAVDEFRRAINSPSHGFTRVNLELGKALLRLGRPAEAVPVLRSALHGDVDGSNLYVTRTELHEALGQAFAQLGTRDSAAVHYRAVVRAWANADPVFHARREQASDWLVRFSPLVPSSSAATPPGPPIRESVAVSARRRSPASPR